MLPPPPGAVQVLVAQSLAAEGVWREAERLYCEAGEWKAAVQMYRGQEAWEDALRVAKVYGGQGAAKQVGTGRCGERRRPALPPQLPGRLARPWCQEVSGRATPTPQVAYAWAVTLGAEAGVQMLKRTGLLDAAVEYASQSGAFQQAFALATAGGLRAALPDIHLRYAMALEDEGRFQEAEAEFVAAGARLSQGAGRRAGGLQGLGRRVVAATLTAGWRLTGAPGPHLPTLCLQASHARPWTCGCTARTGRRPAGWRSSTTRPRSRTCCWRRRRPPPRRSSTSWPSRCCCARGGRTWR